jgi:uncharacterized protein (TIGR00255 family)
MSIVSMTGFGAGAATEGREKISVELKSVNGKFCEVKARLPRELAALEADVVKLVKERIGRGSIDLSARRSSPEGLEAVPLVNRALLTAYAGALREAAQSAGLTSELGVRDLLTLEGVVRLDSRPPDLAAAGKALASAVSTALTALVDVRQREGAALGTDLGTRLQLLRKLSAQAAAAVPTAINVYRERLQTRVKEIASDLELDPQRLEQEIVLFAERTDVTEELIRLNAHFEEFDRLLMKSGPVGRQLDFLIQEINREVNTTGSKSQSTEISRLIVEMKTEVERLREQVQNVE